MSAVEHDVILSVTGILLLLESYTPFYYFPFGTLWIHEKIASAEFGFGEWWNFARPKSCTICGIHCDRHLFGV
jgi:hypothetical protein